MKRLGFKCFGAEIPPPEYVEGMRKNKNGEVIGFLFVFWKKFYIDMSRFFNELDVKNGFKIRLKDGSHVKVRFDLLEGTKWDSFTRTIKILSKHSSTTNLYGYFYIYYTSGRENITQLLLLSTSDIQSKDQIQNSPGGIKR